MMTAAAVTVIEPLVKKGIETAVERILAPQIERLLKEKHTRKNLDRTKIQDAFKDYLLRMYGKLSYMNTLVFGSQQKRLLDLYVPLTIYSSGPAQESFRLTDWDARFVPAFKRVIITDTAGMGKSTILKHLFLCAISNSGRIPLFVELRTLSSANALLKKLYDDLCPIDKPFNRDLLLQLITSGNFVFFLDGFDEVAFDERRKVTEDIQDFISKAFSNWFIIASRHETALASFGEFREFTIKPLTRKEAYSLLRKYDETQEYADALIKALDDRARFEKLKDLLVNPMLVSLLFKAYTYKPTEIPFKKHIFYRQVFDALFDMHDATKGAFVRKKCCGLDIDDFHLIMRDIGFTSAKAGKIEYDREELTAFVKGARERNNSILFQPTEFLVDLVTTVPLFNREGQHYRWAHKSVQDYFASQYIARDSKEHEAALLERIYDGCNCARFENILDLYHDTDSKPFRRVLLAKFLAEYIDFYNSSYNAVFHGVGLELIAERKQLAFGRCTAIMLTKEAPGSVGPDRFVPLEKFLRSSRKGMPANYPISFWIIELGAGKHMYVAQLNFPAAGLLPLLLQKDYSFVKKAPFVVPFEPEGLRFGVPEIVNDDPESVLNTPELFSWASSALAHTGYHINIEHAKRTLDAIKGEAAPQKEVLQMLVGL